jgi:hypothetical protein
MTVLELKEKLIAQIRDTDNEEILDHISDLFDIQYNTNDVHIMSKGEIDAVREGLEQIKNGQCISDEEASRLVEEWLKK